MVVLGARWIVIVTGLLTLGECVVSPAYVACAAHELPALTQSPVYWIVAPLPLGELGHGEGQGAEALFVRASVQERSLEDKVRAGYP